MSTLGTAAADVASPHIDRGLCVATYAFDVGWSVDLAAAEQRLRDALRPRRRAPAYFVYQPPPLRVGWARQVAPVAGFAVLPTADVVIYDFGAILVCFGIELRGSLDRLLELGGALYDNESLRKEAKSVVDDVLAQIAPTVRRLNLAEVVEDYAIYQIEQTSPPVDPAALLREQRALLAGVLRAESGGLSGQEIDDALSLHASFRPDDLTVVDWNAALVLDRQPEDVRGVLEFANVELLEMRHLDRELDRALAALAGPEARGGSGLFHGGLTRLRRIARLHVDAAMLFEEVNNTLKLVGDQYLARVYRLASQRLHLSEWDASILRKLQVLDGIYQKEVDHQAARRMELLEWIIIILIAISIVLPILVPGIYGH